MQFRQTNQIVYKDFDLNMRSHPVTGKLLLKKNDESIKQALKNLILTNFYERPFRSDFGSDIRAQLFELYTPTTESILRNNIAITIENYEPRVDVLDIKLFGSPDEHKLDITIVFRTKNSQNISEVSVSVDRIR